MGDGFELLNAHGWWEMVYSWLEVVYVCIELLYAQLVGYVPTKPRIAEAQVHKSRSMSNIINCEYAGSANDESANVGVSRFSTNPIVPLCVHLL